MLLHLWVLKKIARATVSNTSVTQMSYAIAESKTFNSASSCDSLCLSAFAVGRNVRVTFPVVGLQVQLHQPFAQETKAGWTPTIRAGKGWRGRRESDSQVTCHPTHCMTAVWHGQTRHTCTTSATTTTTTGCTVCGHLLQAL